VPVSSQLSQAVIRIREMILQGQLSPGSRVAEAPLADRLGTSRTPVRQALPVLAREGLLMVNDTRGYVVRAFTSADIVDAIELRALLEGLAARRIAEKGPGRSFLRALRVCIDDGDALLARRRIEPDDEARYAEMNARFHSMIVEEAGSRILADALERNSHVPFAGPQALAFDSEKLAQMYDMLSYAHRQHHLLFDALERGEATRAEALMREHAISVKDSININGFPLAAESSTARLSRALAQ
jgi:GntR family transcriptional regulator, vanillate catabolism transcriptional regulator